MKSVRGVRSLSTPLSQSVVTIGNFDGIHLGHRQLVNRVIESAEAAQVPSVVMTFDPHPVQILQPERELRRLFDIKDLEEQLDALGVDYLVVEPFSREFSELPPERFVRDWLVRPLSPSKVIVGYDFGFGANKSGTISLLENMGRDLGFAVESISPFKQGSTLISSSRIRQALSEGDVELAQQLLGRPFSVRGVVEKGDGRGRSLGFPTANLLVFAETLPLTGVYVTRATVGDQTLPSVTNVGRNPTFQTSQRFPSLRVETHILQGSPDLYGREMKVEFLQRLREERRFSGPVELKTQIGRDVDKARSYFKADS